jgi:hypothetical protein
MTAPPGIGWQREYRQWFRRPALAPGRQLPVSELCPRAATARQRSDREVRENLRRSSVAALFGDAARDALARNVRG